MDASIPTRRPGSRLGVGLMWIYQTIAFYFVLAAFGVVFLGWNLPATLLYWVLPRHVSKPLGQRAIMGGFRALLALMRVSGLAQFDLSAIDALRDEPGLVIAPNHPTLLDALLVTSRLPRVVCITKASLWNNPALGAGAKLAGYIRNDAPHRLVRRAASAVRGGSQLLIFPEGTRTTIPPLGAFKGGFALMARQAGAPVQTVFLEATSPYLSKGWPLVRRPAFPLHYRARLGRRFIVDGPAERFCATLESYMRTELGRP
ncbi:1-acyl-sn-glycerol-3-phosphate acyltransferase [Acidisphaera sp. L21]|uniref:lysophospholipid acyltransferase family protein n=1 Tax=Acidisphaera sp. L21 TaxID=1641851 RepID=UPI00131C12BC|nr:lysophospholipid acyltransferase family protein [Acidisphaera sp. L21]